MAGPRGFVATSIALVALEVVLTADGQAFGNVTGLLGVPGRVAEWWLSPSVPTLGAAAAPRTGTDPTGGSLPASDRPGLSAATSSGTGTASLSPSQFNVVPMPTQVPTPQLAPAIAPRS